MANIKENRKHTRLKLVLKAEITLPSGKIVKGNTQNISFGGALLELSREAQDLKINTECSFSIVLQDTAEKRITIDFQTRIIHFLKNKELQTESIKLLNVGLKFLKIDFTSYQHFENLMVRNSPNPDILLKELEEHPGINLD